MDLNWLRQEVSKNKEDVDWLSVLDTVNKIYIEENNNKSFLGINKGFVNLVRVSDYDQTGLKDEILQMYPKVKIYRIFTQSQAIKLIKQVKNIIPEVNKNLVTENLVVFLTDKSTIESVLTRYKLPFVKYWCSTGQTDNDRTKSKKFYRWRRDGEKGMKWIEGQGLGIKRDILIEELLTTD